MATQRIVALVDMDCFYCQVEAKFEPSLKGKPVAVVQYNQWKGGGIIAVNYEARNRGVSRYMRGEEAKKACPDIILVAVPTIRGKADLSKYRESGADVAEVFTLFSDIVQRASVDEAYIDITKAVNDRIQNGCSAVSCDQLPSSFVVGYSDMKSNNQENGAKSVRDWLKAIENDKGSDSPEFRLAVGGVIIEEMRAAVLRETGFHCSAGIAHNKILAKLVAGLHKPNCQTILPHDSVPELYDTLPINKVRSLGGKLGKLVADKLGVEFMSQLYKFTQAELQAKIDEKTGCWLYNIARGVDHDPVTPRLIPDSIGCCKNFPGKNALGTKQDVEHWLLELAKEIEERLSKDLDKNKRRAKQMTVSFCQEHSMTRSGPLSSYTAAGISNEAMALLKKSIYVHSTSDIWEPPIKFLGISVGKFVEEQTSIGKFLQLNASKSKNSQEATTSKYFQQLSESNSTDSKRQNGKKKELHIPGSINKYFQKDKNLERKITDELKEDEASKSSPKKIEPKTKSFLCPFLKSGKIMNVKLVK